MPHLFSHPEKLYWITSKPFLIFCSAIWGPVSYQGKCITLRNILIIFFSGSVTFVSYLTLIFLSVFPWQYFKVHFQLIFFSLCPLPKCLSLILFPFIPVLLSSCPPCAAPCLISYSELSHSTCYDLAVSLPSSPLELVQRSWALSLLPVKCQKIEGMKRQKKRDHSRRKETWDKRRRNIVPRKGEVVTT